MTASSYNFRHALRILVLQTPNQRRYCLLLVKFGAAVDATESVEMLHCAKKAKWQHLLDSIIQFLWRLHHNFPPTVTTILSKLVYRTTAPFHRQIIDQERKPAAAEK